MIREEPQTPTTAADGREYKPLTLTGPAAQKLQSVMAEKGLADAGLRVFVHGGGCSGLQYGMAFVTESEPNDIVFASEGVRIHVDPVSIEYVHGANIDFEDNLMGGGFKIDNPNAVSSCGCGNSFRTGQGAGQLEGGCGGSCGC